MKYDKVICVICFSLLLLVFQLYLFKKYMKYGNGNGNGSRNVEGEVKENDVKKYSRDMSSEESMKWCKEICHKESEEFEKRKSEIEEKEKRKEEEKEKKEKKEKEEKEAKEKSDEEERRRRKNVAFLVMGTGKYKKFIPRQIRSFDQYLFVDVMDKYDWRLFYFVDFDNNNDNNNNSFIIEHPKVYYIYQKRLQWPYDSMNRNHVYIGKFLMYQNFDYVFALDVDLFWSVKTGGEIIGNSVAVRHLGYEGVMGTFETRPQSTAFIPEDVRKECIYRMGGFFGGNPEFIKTFFTFIINSTRTDALNGITAVWHDESYLNRYFCYKKPENDLNYHFMYPETWDKSKFFNEDTRMTHYEKKNPGELRS